MVRIYKGAAPLHIAANFKNNDAVKILLENNANPNLLDNSQRTPIFYTAQDPLIIKTLLAKNANINIHDVNGMTPLMYAAWNNYHSTKKILKKSKETINNRDSSNRTALNFAIESQNPKTVKLLLTSGAIPSQEDYDLALSKENEAIRTLIKDAYSLQQEKSQNLP